jgi:ankyrin repeat protein
VLSKFLADKELQTAQSQTTCYFFFKDDNENQKTATNALCAILHQLFSQKPELLKHAVKCHEQNGDKLIENVDLLWNLLATASTDPQSGEIICVLDALDECRRSELRILLRKLCSFYNQHPRRNSDNMSLKFLVTSRPLEYIGDEFNDLAQEMPTIRLAGEENTDQIRDEINLVIEYEISKIQQKRHLNHSTVRILRNELTKVEHRTYLWLKLVIELLNISSQSITKQGRDQIFGTIPTTVDAAYTAILNQIRDKKQAWKLLQIVCAAVRPLSVDEISIAMLIRESDKAYKDLEIHHTDFSKGWIRNLCGLFVSIIDGRVYLLHQTAKEFLLAQDVTLTSAPNIAFDGNWRHSISVPGSNLVLAQSCMWYLQLDKLYRRVVTLSAEEIAQLISQFTLLEYSATNWAVHFRAASISNENPLFNIGLQLCDVDADQHKLWIAIYLDNIALDWTGFTSLHLASYLGLVMIAGQLLTAPGVNVNAVDSDGWTALHQAASDGHEAIISQLLAAGIDVNATDSDGWTALHQAASNGHEAIVSQLVAAGIDVNATDSDGRTALHWAASEGHEAIVSQLVAAGIDVNATDSHGQTALHRAASYGHEAIVSQLVAAGIDVNATDSHGRTALHRAASYGHEAIVSQLVAVPGIITRSDRSTTDLDRNSKAKMSTLSPSFPALQPQLL